MKKLKILKNKKKKHSKNKTKGKERITIKPNEKFITRDIDPKTGSRFPGKARQLALELVIKLSKEGKVIKEIREEFLFYNKEEGFEYNLDPGYVNFVISCHPEFFELYTDGTLVVIKEPKPDIEAYRKTKSYINSIKESVNRDRKKRRQQALNK